MGDLISREALIESVKTWDMQDLYLPTHFIDLIEDEPSVTDTNVGSKWIPCSERLPEKSGTYIVTGMWKGEPREIWMCKLLVLESFCAGWCNDARKPVIDAWMPLPEPYKGE